MKEYLEDKGVEVALGTTCEELVVEAGKAVGVRTGRGETYYGKYIIVGPGGRGSEWLVAEGKRLGLKATVNPVDIGSGWNCRLKCSNQSPPWLYESKFIYYSRSFEDRVRTFCIVSARGKW